jgi:hypothetical protein
VAVVALLTSWPSDVPARPLPAGLERLRSGLLAADAFDAPLPLRSIEDRDVFNGSARNGVGYASASAAGLLVGVHPHRGWAGWFAVTLHAAGPQALWRTVMWRPAAPRHGGERESVFAVQTASTQHTGAINYIVVSAVLRPHGASFWLVGYAHGVVADADTETLWRSPIRPGDPVAQPVAVLTDGRRSLDVWIGGHEVVHRDDLRLDIPAPFQAYLEVQARDNDAVARFRDFSVSEPRPLVLRGLPAHAVARLSVAGRLAAAARADGSGTAELALRAPWFAGRGTLAIDGARGSRRFAGVPFAGGDVLALRG